MQTTNLFHFRTMHYIEVCYFEKGRYASRKLQHYSEEEAMVIYQRTINKLKEDKKTALICLREENHNLIRSEWLKQNQL